MIMRLVWATGALMISEELEAGWITKPLWCWPANDIASSKSVPFLKFKLRSWDYDHKGITNEISFHHVRFSCTRGGGRKVWRWVHTLDKTHSRIERQTTSPTRKDTGRTRQSSAKCACLHTVNRASSPATGYSGALMEDVCVLLFCACSTADRVWMSL